MAYAEKYTLPELMVATVARMITNDDNVVVGMGVPIIAGAVAQNTTAPDATFIYECGGVGPRNRRIPWTVTDGPTTDNALGAFPMASILGDLQRGRLTLAVLGGAEVDMYGNLNSSMMPGGNNDDYQHPRLRLPGPGGATDLAIFAKRVLIMMSFSKGDDRKNFVKKVKFVTSPGYLDGPGCREKMGYPGGGPEAVLTDKAIFKFDEKTKEMYLWKIFPGVKVEEITSKVEWDLKIADPLEVVEPPTEEQIKVMHAYDPQNLVIGRAGSIFENFEDYYTFMRKAYQAMTVNLDD